LEGATQQSSATLWQAFKQGNKAAYEELFNRHFNELYYYSFKLCGNEALCKDSIQELFLELWDKRNNLGDVSSVKNYLIKSIRRKVIRTQVQSERRLLRLQNNVDPDSLFQLSAEDLLIYNQAEKRQKLRLNTAINTLTTKQKEIIYLKYHTGLDYKDIAAVLGIRYQSVRNHMHKAITKLREVLADFYD